MAAIYICSTEKSAGKTMFAVGLGRAAARRGGKVGYLKPVSVTAAQLNGNRVDQDAAFAKQALSLGESLEVLSPVLFPPGKASGALAQLEPIQRIKDAYSIVSRERDVIFAEGAEAIDEGAQAGVLASKIIEALGAKALLVVRYRGDATIRKTKEAIEALGHPPPGIVINFVPNEQVAYVDETVVPELERSNLSVLGIFPLERALLGSSVGELAEFLGGSVVCCPNRLDGTIESVMIGARSFSSGLPYFKRKNNKAVVTGADRQDIQLAALETSTRCIVATSGGELNPIVIERAKEVQVPLIRVAHDTIETVERIEQFLAGIRFRQAQNIQRLDQLVAAHLDFDTVAAALDVPRR